MNFRSAIFGAILAGSSFAGGVSQVSAAVLYTNGPINGHYDAWGVGSGYAVYDSFILTSASTVTDVTFGAWTLGRGSSITSIDWAITTTPKTYPKGSAAAVTTVAQVDLFLFNGYSVNEDSFSTGKVSLAAGTYYLLLENASPVGSWDVNNGPSAAYTTGFGSPDLLKPRSGSNAFEILGTASAVPESSTWAMILVGFAGLGVVGYRQKRKTEAAALAA